MSRDHQERVSRIEEIRALFIFGLLAVFASIRVQNQTLTLTYPNGSFNLAPIIDIILILWSLYAFFMVLGLSSDIIGTISANTFRDISKIFLQYSYFILPFFLIPFAFLVYGTKIIFILLIILNIIIVAIYFKITNRSKKTSHKIKIRSFLTTVKIKRNLPYILILIFLIAATLIFSYPEDWYGSSIVLWGSFIVAVVAVSTLIGFKKSKNDDNKLDDDYYFLS